MTTLYGHERETLLWALRAGEWPAFNWADRGLQAKWDAHEAVTDPAKLAELLAEALRERGIVAASLSRDGRCIIAFVDTQGNTRRREPDLPQARALLLRILTLPDGATAEDATRAISGDSFEIPPEIPLREHPEPRQFDPDPDRERDA
jgi:hypothetical protein